MDDLFEQDELWINNKGEWSEAYVLLRVVGDGIIYAGDENSNKKADTYMKVLSAIKRNADNILECARENEDEDDPNIKCYIQFDNRLDDPGIVCGFKASFFSELADLLIERLKNAETSDISVPEVQRLFMMMFSSIKQASAKPNDPIYLQGKTDIAIKSLNPIDQEISTVGFSIKSYVGAKPTLFNTAPASALVYRLDNCSRNDYSNLISIVSPKGHPDIAKRIEYIKEKEIVPIFVDSFDCPPVEGQFDGLPGPHFRWNLDFYDRRMVHILADALLEEFGYYSERKSSLVDIADALAERNPLNERAPQSFYRAKLSDLVYMSFGKMTASKEWRGEHIINGGYIEVLKNGDVLYYKANSDDQFKRYLLNHTKFESPSTDPIKKKYNHGIVFEKEGDYYLSVNFSIRFK